jgi:hypothetical protein
MRVKLLTSILATHNIVADKVGTVLEVEDGRAGELIAMGYVEETSDAETKPEDTAFGIMQKQHNDRLLADKKGKAIQAAAAAKETAADLEEAEKADAAGERVGTPGVITSEKAGAGPSSNKNVGNAPKNKSEK